MWATVYKHATSDININYWNQVTFKVRQLNFANQYI